MNVLETIQKSIDVIDKLKKEDVADYEVYKSLKDGKCCLVGNIAEQFGCEGMEEWALGEDKPCLIETFGDRDLADIIDVNLSKIHQDYVNQLGYEKDKSGVWGNSNIDQEYWDTLPKLTFEEMKKEAKKFLKSLLPKGGK